MSSPVYYYNTSPYAAHVPLPPSPYGSPYTSPYGSPYGVHIALPPSPIGYAMSVPLPPSPVPRNVALPRTPTRNPLPLPPSGGVTTAHLAAGTKFTPHPLLTLDVQDPSITWDTRLPPDSIRMAQPPRPYLTVRHLDQPALSPPWTFIRLRSALLPWLVEVSNPAGVTVGDVLNAVYGCLRDRVTKDEWRDTTKEFQGRLLDAWGRRCDLIGEEEGRAAGHRERQRGIRRVDWLLWDLEWLGMERSEGELETWDMHFRAV